MGHFIGRASVDAVGLAAGRRFTHAPGRRAWSVLGEGCAWSARGRRWGGCAPANRTAVPDMGRFIGSAHPWTEVSAPGRQHTTGRSRARRPKAPTSDPVVLDRRRISLPGPPAAVPAGDSKPKPTRSPFRCRKQQEVEGVGDSPPPAARSHPGPGAPGGSPSAGSRARRRSPDRLLKAPRDLRAPRLPETRRSRRRAPVRNARCAAGSLGGARLAPTRRPGTPDGPARSGGAPRPTSQR
jgi:hypothetical protein